MALPPVKPFNPNSSNLDILNAVRKNASIAYQERIPFVTKANIQQTIHNLLEWAPTRNEFIDALVNRIGGEIFRNTSWSNPYAKFKGGMLAYGDTIEEIYVGLLNAKVYDPNRPSLEQELFGLHSPEVQTSFHKINRQNYYVITINDAMLRRAFESDTGLSSMITQLMEAPTKSDEWDEYLAMTSLFAEYENSGGFFHVNVPDLADEDADSAAARQALKKFRAWAGTLQFLSRHYNAAGMPVAAKPEDLELFITPEGLATIDVDGLAAAFQIDKAEVPFRINIIPQEDIGIPGAVAILTTRDFFVVRDTVMEARQQPNAGSLATNYFYHHHQIVSVSRFVPAILFWTGEGDVIPVVETPVTGIEPITVYDLDGVTVAGALERGNVYQIRTAATTDGSNDAVSFELLPGTESSFTYVRPNGLLFVGVDEDAASISVGITATDDNDETATLTRSIVGDKVELWPNPKVDPDADLDNVFEVTPNTLSITDAGNVRIPSQDGLDWTKTIATGVTFTDAGDIVTIPHHGLAVNDKVKFGTITGTTGITAGTEYFVKTVPSPDTVTLSATEGGSTLVLTTNGTAANAVIPVDDGKLVNIAVGQTVTFTAAATTGYELAPGATSVFPITRA